MATTTTYSAVCYHTHSSVELQYLSAGRTNLTASATQPDAAIFTIVQFPDSWI